MSKFVTNKVVEGNLLEHPAVRAWLALHGENAVQQRVIILKDRGGPGGRRRPSIAWRVSDRVSHLLWPSVVSGRPLAWNRPSMRRSSRVPASRPWATMAVSTKGTANSVGFF